MTTLLDRLSAVVLLRVCLHGDSLTKSRDQPF